MLVADGLVALPFMKQLINFFIITSLTLDGSEKKTRVSFITSKSYSTFFFLSFIFPSSSSFCAVNDRRHNTMKVKAKRANTSSNMSRLGSEHIKRSKSLKVKSSLVDMVAQEVHVQSAAPEVTAHHVHSSYLPEKHLKRQRDERWRRRRRRKRHKPIFDLRSNEMLSIKGLFNIFELMATLALNVSFIFISHFSRYVSESDATRHTISFHALICYFVSFRCALLLDLFIFNVYRIFLFFPFY